ncbi:MAG: proline dehydrogenase [Dehalococcoidia bacterium]|nr:proline dehydrogenase [Dehalococcoidia bacterium]
MAGALFRSLGESRRARDLLTGNVLGRRLARRFVAGETLDDAVVAVEELNGRGLDAAIALLGEHAPSEEEASRAVAVYQHAASRIHSRSLSAYLSPKLTQLGLDLSEDLCRRQLRSILQAAEEAGVFVRIDMEGSRYTETTLRVVEDLHREFPAVGTVLQSYLRRTPDDLERLLAQEIPVRLVKGAYSEPHSIAFPTQEEVERAYESLTARLLEASPRAAIATHNDRLLGYARKLAVAREIPLSGFEFQMLYGIRRAEQERLAAAGYSVRVYVPFGPDWFAYFMRRLGERPANAVFLLRNILR